MHHFSAKAQAQVRVIATLVHLAAFDRCPHGTAGFVAVGAIAELAVWHQVTHFTEIRIQLLAFNIPQRQGAQTGHVIDAMDGRGALHAAIKPIDDKRSQFVGMLLHRGGQAHQQPPALGGGQLVPHGIQALACCVDGMVDVLRRNRYNYPSRIAVAHSGHALGEMSMFDGEPRFASCVTLEHSRIAVLTRDALMLVLGEEPKLGNKILLKLVQLLSERLRQTSAKLVSYLEAARDA